MNLFNLKKKTVDERIENTKNKIYKEAYIFIMGICFVSIAFKYYLYGTTTKHVTTELLVIFLSALYYVIRTVWLGIYTDEIEVHDRTSKLPLGTKNIIIGVVLGIVIAIFWGIRSSILYGNNGNRLWYFIIVFFASIMMYCPFLIAFIAIGDNAARKASKKITQKHEDE
jgi:ABC-type dipeptide/oligopeptide/nickel transport system permease subunit